MGVLVTISEDGPVYPVASPAELAMVLDAAAAEARERSMLNVIFLEAENGNTLNLAVGGEETALGFVHGHGNPPYYVSRGPVPDEAPGLTCFQSLRHHTEYPRCWVIPAALGREAAFEFLSTGRLPRRVEWEIV